MNIKHGHRERKTILGESTPESFRGLRPQVEATLMWVEGFLGLSLAESEKELIWGPTLEAYSNWQLSHLKEYRGDRNLVAVCRFMDALEPEPEKPRPVSGLLEHTPDRANKEMARDFFAYIKKLYSIDSVGPSEEKAKTEREFVSAMRKKYPDQEWICGMKANKGL